MSKKPAKPRKKKFYYHVTDVKNVKPILAKGLKGATTGRYNCYDVDCPTVFVLSSSKETLTNSIACNQIWPWTHFDSYAVIKIDSKGISGPIVQDVCGEATTKWQWMVQQRLIEPEFLALERVTKDIRSRALMDLGLKLITDQKMTSDEWDMAALHAPPHLVVQKLWFQLQQARSAKVLEEIAYVEKLYSHEDFAELQPSFRELRKQAEQKYKAKNKNTKTRAKSLQPT